MNFHANYCFKKAQIALNEEPTKFQEDYNTSILVGLVSGNPSLVRCEISNQAAETKWCENTEQNRINLIRSILQYNIV